MTGDPWHGVRGEAWQYNRADTLYSVQNGNQYVLHDTGGPSFSVQPFVQPEGRNGTDPLKNPSQLLLARNEVVDFIGRDGELEELDQWRGLAGKHKVLLLHGRGGQGKTRLAMEFAKKTGRAGWWVGVAQQRIGGEQAVDLTPTAARSRGHLIVVDYAERWERGDLLALLRWVKAHNGPTRVLLLARSARPWWSLLRHQLRKLDIDIQELCLKQLATDVRSRQQVFAEACACFARILRVDPRHAHPAGSLTHTAYGSVLTIHMAALVAMYARRRKGPKPDHPGALAAYLLDREYDHWASLFEAESIATRPEMLARATFIATVAGPMAHQEGLAALARTGLAANDAEAARILDDHGACYPPLDDGTVLEPLSPDRLGEDFVAGRLPGGQWASGGRQADPWTTSASNQLLTMRQPGLLASSHARLITTLAETSKRWVHVQAHLFALLRVDPRQAAAAGGAALMVVADIADLGLLASIEPHLPAHHLDLDPAAARITQRLTAHRLGNTNSLADHAHLRANLGWRLGNIGAYAQARDETESAIRLLRDLVTGAPNRHRPALAWALHNLGSYHAGLGRREAALAATSEAADIRRCLTRADLIKFGPGLVQTLNNLADDLGNLYLRESALKAAEEAADVHHHLAEADPITYQAGFARSLTNLGRHRHGVGRCTEAVLVTRQAVALHRRLTAAAPAVHTPDLAASLHNLAAYLADLGERDEAESVAKEAVALRARLVTVNRGMFEPDLTASLRNLASIHADLGDFEFAVQANGQARDFYERAVNTNVDLYGPELASTLSNHGVYLARLGKRSEALVASEKAAAIREDLTRRKLAVYEKCVVGALKSLGISFVAPTRRRESVVSADPVIRNLQHVVDQVWCAGLITVPSSASSLSKDLLRVARLSTVIAANPTAAASLHLPGRSLAACEAQWAQSLGNLSLRLAEAHRPTDAIAIAEQAAQGYVHLMRRDATAHLPGCVSSLTNLALLLAQLGRRDRALAVSRYAANLSASSLAARGNPSSILQARCLMAFAWIRATIGREFDDALSAIYQSTSLYYEIARPGESSFLLELQAAAAIRTALLGQLETSSQPNGVLVAMATPG
jgi:hypothetical protein